MFRAASVDHNARQHSEGSTMQLTAVLMPAPEGGFTAFNPETGSTTQGDSIEEALGNLREATSLYIEEFPLVPGGPPLLTTFEVRVHVA
jgi:predicted RNase H-like HicB family nuclease